MCFPWWELCWDCGRLWLDVNFLLVGGRNHKGYTRVRYLVQCEGIGQYVRRLDTSRSQMQAHPYGELPRGVSTPASYLIFWLRLIADHAGYTCVVQEPKRVAFSSHLYRSEMHAPKTTDLQNSHRRWHLPLLLIASRRHDWRISAVPFDMSLR